MGVVHQGERDRGRREGREWRWEGREWRRETEDLSDMGGAGVAKAVEGKAQVLPCKCC